MECTNIGPYKHEQANKTPQNAYNHPTSEYRYLNEQNTKNSKSWLLK